MKRKIYDQLLQWKLKEKGSVALLIEGARRVGKSYIVELFAKNEYRSHILVNFAHISKEMQMVFDEYLNDIDTFLMFLQNVSGIKLYERESIIIFDEIQECPDARTALKFFKLDGRFDVIGTGSLLGVSGYGKEPKSVPVGYETVIDMHPLDFEEFLWANGYSKETVYELKNYLGSDEQRWHRACLGRFETSWKGSYFTAFS